MTRSALDCALMLEAIAGYDPADPYSVNRKTERFSAGIDIGIRGRRIGVPSSYFFEGLEPEAHESVRRALDVLSDLGAVLVDIETSLGRGGVRAKHRGGRGRLGASTSAGRPRYSRGDWRGYRFKTRAWEPILRREFHGFLNRRHEIAALAASLMEEVDLIATLASARESPDALKECKLSRTGPT